MSEYYQWFKWLHILAVISWMAGMLYLPRLFVYHVETTSEEVKREYQNAELKLLKRIMNPAMIVTWISGFCLIAAIVDMGSEFWIWAKLALVLAMSAFHGMCAKWRKQLLAGTCDKSGKFFRFANEIPTLLMIGIVGLVVFKPF
ncbi:UNVERIFIED_CONTAM: hypothetical protein GTU68_008813 [Idotea baltica]|nr:hypothetical protein [Idotea baltica]